jgi:NADPH:quinone reductase-like Zn-dependent oxidoreductase
VGAYAVQLASHAGATVIATASGDDEAYLKSIGAGRVIDYREAQFEKVLREKVDVVFDLVGGETQKRSFLVLKEGGHLVSAGGQSVRSCPAVAPSLRGLARSSSQNKCILTSGKRAAKTGWLRILIGIRARGVPGV